MLKINNLTAIYEDFELLDDINLEINTGELHSIIGPERSGKSSLAQVILGNSKLSIKDGSIYYKNNSILEKTIADRATAGIFVTYQYPPSIEGISNIELIKIILKAKNDTRTPNELERDYKECCKKLALSSAHGNKQFNYVVPDIDHRKNEILQMLMLNPEFVVFDEIDTGLEDDEVNILASCIKDFLSNNNKAAIVITHNRAFLDLLQPTHVHVMVDGEILETGSTDLYKRILENGYPQLS